MNKITEQRYERIGAILAQIALQRKISPLERLMIDEFYAVDKSFQSAINLLKFLQGQDEALSLEEIAKGLGTSYEIAKTTIRSMKKGGMEFGEEWEVDGFAKYLVIGLNLKPSALTYLLESLK